MPSRIWKVSQLEVRAYHMSILCTHVCIHIYIYYIYSVICYIAYIDIGIDIGNSQM